MSIYIIFDEVKCDIPLLLSLQLVRKMDLRIRFKHDTAKIPNEPKFRLKEANGHYWVNIGKESSIKDIIENTTDEDSDY